MTHRYTVAASSRKVLFELLMWLGIGSVTLYSVLDLVLGYWVPAVVEITFWLFSITALICSRRRVWETGSIAFVVNWGVVATILGITASQGGLIASGGFMVWVFVCPISGLVLQQGWRRWATLIGSAILVVGWVVAEPWVVPHTTTSPLPPNLQGIFFASNIVCGGTLVIGLILFFLKRLELEERALRVSEERYRATVDRLPSAVSMKDSAGRYLIVNQYFREVFGLASEELDTVSNAVIFPLEILPQIEAVERLVWLGGEVDTGDESPSGVLARNPSAPHAFESEEQLPVHGEMRDFQSVRFLVERGAIRAPALCWIATDITIQKRLQQEVIRAQKLESLGTLAGGIAHDFNNLLMACTGNLSLARNRLEAGSVLDQRLERSELALRRATDLTEQLLTFSRGGAPLRSVVSISRTVRESAAFVLHGSSIVVEFDIPDDLPKVDADLGQIGQIVQNLVLNAVQAMPEGGVVRIACDVKEPGISQPGLSPDRSYVRILVKDTGTGIPEDVRHRIFDPYFTTRSGGRGLGLATCYSIAQSHDGAIYVESETGSGSAFQVWLPVSEGRPSPEIQHRTDFAWLRGARLLVMDDEDEIRDIVATMLTGLGCLVDSVSEGAQAIQRFRVAREMGQPYTAVILDITIKGGMGGVAAMAGILAIDPAARAIAMSGYSQDAVLAEHRRHGFGAVIKKPFPLTELTFALSEILEPKAD